MPKQYSGSLLASSPILALALLAGCGQKNEAPPANTTLDTGVAGNETAVVPAAPVTTAYDCMPALLLCATYGTSGATPTAQLTVADVPGPGEHLANGMHPARPG